MGRAASAEREQAMRLSSASSSAPEFLVTDGLSIHVDHKIPSASNTPVIAIERPSHAFNPSQQP